MKQLLRCFSQPTDPSRAWSSAASIASGSGTSQKENA
jgi:hypothetical protein